MFEFDKIENNDFKLDFQFLNKPTYIKDVRLIQVGKKFCNEQTVVAEHTHIDWFELTVILEGKGTIYTNKHKLAVKEGDIHLSYPCDIHRLDADPTAPMKYAFLSFCLENNVFAKEFDKIATNFHEADKRVFSNPFISQIIESIISEMVTENFGKDDVIYACLEQIFIYVCRNFLHNKQFIQPTSVGKNEILCYKIMRHIDNNIFNIQTLTEISNHFNYNYSYLAKTFKKTTNLTIAQYFSKRKLERAKIMIKEGNLSFTKIAEILNYSSIYSFSKSFKLYYGLSPAEYKRQHSNKHN